MKKAKRLLSVFLSFVMVVTIIPAIDITAFAETTDDGFEYKINENNEITITGYTGSATDLEIPSKIDSYPVTSIGWGALSYCKSLTSVTIPNTVTYLKGYTFSGCSALTSVTIPNSITYIDVCAFSNCSSLISITIPDSVTGINHWVFMGCDSLTSIAVDENNPNYCSVDGVLFNKDKTEIVCHPAGKTNTTYTIPNSVTSIFYGAFGYCTQLTSVIIPDSVTSIGDYSFQSCKSLTSISIPYSVTNIGEHTFSWCEALTSVTIPDSVTSIGNEAFDGCYSLNSIKIPDSVTSIGKNAFFRTSYYDDPCNWTGDVLYIGNYLIDAKETISSNCEIKVGTKIIADFAFGFCDSLTSVTIPDSVTSIGDQVFYDCNSLTSITVDSNNEYYFSVDGVLFNKDKTEIICYPAGKTQTTYTIPNSVTSIGHGAFGYCTQLTSVTIPYTVTSIGAEAFENCENLIITVNCSKSVYEYLCDRYSNIINLIHTEIIECEAIVPTCTTLGYTAGSYCSACGESISGREEISTLSHTMVDGICTVCGSTVYAESEHPYQDDCNETWTINEDGAQSIAVTFSENTCTESGYDFIKLYYADGIQIGSFSGNVLAGFTVEIPGDTLIITLTSDGSVTEYGFAVTAVEALDYVAETPIIPEASNNDSDDGDSNDGNYTIGNTDDGFNYKLFNDGTVTITGYTGSETSIVIPSTVEGNPVTQIEDCAFEAKDFITSVTIGNCYIGSRAFRYCSNLTSVSIDGGTIGTSAFWECTSLNSLVLGDEVTAIGREAFAFTNIENVTIPKNIETIDINPFFGNTKIKNISVDSENEMYCSVNGVVYSKDLQTLVIYPAGKDDNTFIIPDSTVNLGTESFSYCNNLETITIPENVVSIGEIAFARCGNLQSVTVKGASIGVGAFYECDSLTNVELYDGVTSIGEIAFYCSGLESIEIPASVESISYNAFEGCTSLTAINVDSNNPEYCSENGVWFNKDKTHLFLYPAAKQGSSYDIPSSVLYIGSAAFSYSLLEAIAIPDTVFYVDERAFEGCTNLKTANINCYYLGFCPFVCCEALETVTIGENVAYMEYGIFYSCTNLKTAIINSSSIGFSAFLECSSLEKVEFSRNLSTIEEYAFADCSNLKSLSIPNSINCIEDRFISGSGVTDIYYSGTELEWNNIVHNNNTYEGVTIHFNSNAQNIDANLSNDTALINYNDTLTFKAESETATYQWYGCNNEDKSDSVAIIGATSTSFTPFDFFETNNQYNEYKYYYCIADEAVNGVMVKTESPICANALSAISETCYSEIDYSQFEIRSDSKNNINNYLNIVELGEIKGATFTVVPSYSCGETKAYGTGSQLVVTNNAGNESIMDIIIYGDINGDGVIDVLDATAVCLASTDMVPLTGAYNAAADVDSSGDIDVMDYSEIVNKCLS